MKTCIKCGESEPKVTFTAQRKQCKECRKAYLRGYYARNAVYFTEYRQTNAAHINKKSVACQQRSRHERYEAIQKLKSGPCLDCGGQFPWYVMDFDHRNPLTKGGEISTLVKTYVPWSRVLKEIEKCDLVCARCHRLRTYKGDHCYRTRLYRSNRAMTDKIKTETPCADCKGLFKPCQMDFDHVRGAKAGTISQMLGQPQAVVIHEISKCELVCANCHRIRTYERPSPMASERLVLQPEAKERSRERYVRV